MNALKFIFYSDSVYGTTFLVSDKSQNLNRSDIPQTYPLSDRDLIFAMCFDERSRRVGEAGTVRDMWPIASDRGRSVYLIV